MKTKILILTVLFLLSTISFLPGNSNASISKTEKSKIELTSDNAHFDYKYVHVWDGYKWWIYVYDGDVLVDVYPE